MHLVVLLLGAALAGACQTSPTGPTVPLNREFVLAPGETATIADTPFGVRFVRVTGDSRCPADVVCIQGGDAIVELRATSPGGTRTLELHTGDMRPVAFEGLTIALVELQPYPFSTRTIPPQEYRATLRVSR
jgi:hypothetical protein